MNGPYQIIDEHGSLVGAKCRNEINFKNSCYMISDPGKWGAALAGTIGFVENYE